MDVLTLFYGMHNTSLISALIYRKNFPIMIDYYHYKSSPLFYLFQTHPKMFCQMMMNLRVTTHLNLEILCLFPTDRWLLLQCYLDYDMELDLPLEATTDHCKSTPNFGISSLLFRMHISVKDFVAFPISTSILSPFFSLLPIDHNHRIMW